MRVATWNIRATIGAGPIPDRWWSRIDADRLRAIGSFIASVEVDVIALQEVAIVSRNGDLVDNPGDLARQLGMEVRYGAVRAFDVVEADARVGVGTFGNAFLSRLPIRSSRTVGLPQAPSGAFVEPAGSDHTAAGIRYADAPDHVREPRCLLLADVDGLTRRLDPLQPHRLRRAPPPGRCDRRRPRRRVPCPPARRPQRRHRGARARAVRRLDRWVPGSRRRSVPRLDRRRRTDRPGAGAGRIGPWLPGSARLRRPERPLPGRGRGDRSVIRTSFVVRACTVGAARLTG